VVIFTVKTVRRTSLAKINKSSTSNQKSLLIK